MVSLRLVPVAKRAVLVGYSAILVAPRPVLEALRLAPVAKRVILVGYRAVLVGSRAILMALKLVLLYYKLVQNV